MRVKCFKCGKEYECGVTKCTECYYYNGDPEKISYLVRKILHENLCTEVVCLTCLLKDLVEHPHNLGKKYLRARLKTCYANTKIGNRTKALLASILL